MKFESQFWPSGQNSDSNSPTVSIGRRNLNRNSGPLARIPIQISSVQKMPIGLLIPLFCSFRVAVNHVEVMRSYVDRRHLNRNSGPRAIIPIQIPWAHAGAFFI